MYYGDFTIEKHQKNKSQTVTTNKWKTCRFRFLNINIGRSMHNMFKKRRKKREFS